MSLGFDLDHIALAALDTSDALRFLTGELGGTVIFGGESIGFRPMQVLLGSHDGAGSPAGGRWAPPGGGAPPCRSNCSSHGTSSATISSRASSTGMGPARII